MLMAPAVFRNVGIAGIGGPMSDITIATLRQTLLATADMAAAMRAYMVMTNLGVLARGIAFGISLTVSPSRHRPSAIWASSNSVLVAG